MPFVHHALWLLFVHVIHVVCARHVMHRACTPKKKLDKYSAYMVAAVTLHGLNSFKWSVTHALFLVSRNSLPIFCRLWKNEKIYVGSLNFFFYPCTIESCQNCVCQGLQMPSLKIKGHHQLNICNIFRLAVTEAISSYKDK